MGERRIFRLVAVFFSFLFVLFLLMISTVIGGLYSGDRAQLLGNIGQWLSFLWGWPVAVLGVAVTLLIARAGNAIATGQTDLELLKFTHERLVEVNSSAIGFATDLEALVTATEKSMDIALNLLVEEFERARESNPEMGFPDLLKEAFKKLDEDDGGRFKNTINEVIGELKSVPHVMRSLSEKPFVLALLRRSKNRGSVAAFPDRINEIVGRELVDSNPLSIARRFDFGAINEQNIIEVLRFQYSMHGYGFEDIQLAGLVLDNWCFTIDRPKPKGPYALVVNVGLANLCMLFSLLPSTAVVMDTVSELLSSGGKIASLYASIAGPDTEDTASRELVGQIDQILKNPSQCILVLAKGEDGLEWRTYNEEMDGKFSWDQISYSWLEKIESEIPKWEGASGS